MPRTLSPLTVARWQSAIGQLARLDIADLDELNPDQRALIEFSLRKVMGPMISWLSKQMIREASAKIGECVKTDLEARDFYENWS